MVAPDGVDLSFAISQWPVFPGLTGAALPEAPRRSSRIWISSTRSPATQGSGTPPGAVASVTLSSFADPRETLTHSVGDCVSPLGTVSTLSAPDPKSGVGVGVGGGVLAVPA